MSYKRGRVSFDEVNKSLGHERYKRKSKNCLKKPETNSASTSQDTTLNLIRNYDNLADENNDILSNSADCLSSDEDFSGNNCFSERLYKGCEHSEETFLTTILAFITRHHLSKKAVEDLLQIFQKFLPESSKIPTSFYRFEKTISKLQHACETVKVCNYCHTSRKKNDLPCNCEQSLRDKSTSKDSKIVIFDVFKQLSEICSNNFADFQESYKNSCDILKDFVFSPLHCKITAQAEEPGYRVSTLTLSTDGAPIKKCGDLSIWPISGIVNEVKANKRFLLQNLILIGFWLGPSKPDIKLLFQKTLLDQLKRTFLVRFNSTTYKFKLVISTLVCDIPAKAMVLNISNFNGYYGCPYCLHPGNRKNPRVHEYPHRSVLYPPKTAEFYKIEKEKIIAGQISEKGVKGTSIVQDLLEIPDQIPIGYMHNILEGVLTTIFHSPYFSKRETLTYLDRFKHLVRFPHESCRKLEAFSKFSSWKASQIFLILYLLPIFKWCKPEFFYHLSLVITSTRIMLQPDITKNDTKLAKNLTRCAYKLTRKLFPGKETINMHMFGDHLADQVKNMGPLWAQAEFVFENANKIMKDNVYGSRGQENSISRGFLWQNLAYKSAFSSKNSLQELQKKILRPYSTNSCLTKGNISALHPFSVKVSAEESSLLEKFEHNSYKAFTCYRIRIDNVKYHSKSYYRANSCDSFTIYAEHENCKIFGEILQFFVTTQSVYALLSKYELVENQLLFDSLPSPTDKQVAYFLNRNEIGQHFIPARLTQETVLIPARCIVSKCVVSYDVPDPSDLCYLTLYDIRRHFT